MNIFVKYVLLLTLAFSIIISCKEKEEVKEVIEIEQSNKEFPVISEEFLSPWNDDDNIDSPTFYQTADGRNLIIATSKAKHNLFIYNAENGELVKTIGKEGNGQMEFARPNGIWVIENLLLVCERDNHRIQVINLKDFSHVGFIGEEYLKYPYGITVYKNSDDEFTLFVTDNYEGENDEAYPHYYKLNERVHKYSFKYDESNRNFESKLIKKFGDTSGPGMLWVVESIYADPDNNRLLIAEEDKNNLGIKIYDLEGNFTGIIIGDDEFEYQAEGIALYDCGNGEGYWFCTDQDYYNLGNNTFHIYDRKSMKYLSSFISKTSGNTDGIWLSQLPFGKFNKGIFIAVHNDGGVGIFDLNNILNTLNLKCK
ncbi:MAG: phytase [Candidatus Kapabacteria bacterium]|nr:phytase [Ignavibacteriota bacterium]MCW5883391.1 phytase [Candidatus Kapabacteria bacterium]